MRSLLRFLCLAPCALAGSVASSEPTDGEARMLSHSITIRLEPTTGRFVAKDVVTFDTSKGRAFAVILPITQPVPPTASTALSGSKGVATGVVP
jgi:hypothetical protein